MPDDPGGSVPPQLPEEVAPPLEDWDSGTDQEEGDEEGADVGDEVEVEVEVEASVADQGRDHRLKPGPHA